MFELLVWVVYGLFVGSLAKSIVPSPDHIGMIKTIIIGIIGSYFGGALLYIVGQYSSVSPAGIFMGVCGASIALLLYNKLRTNN